MDNGYKINKVIADNMILESEDLDLKILAPEKNYNDKNLNNHSVVLKLNYMDNSFIFTGDAEKESEVQMINMNYDLNADVLKAGHHGSNTSSSDSFLNKVNPQYVVITCGLNNRYDHLDSALIYNLEKRDIKVFRTDLHGTIVVQSDGKKISFKTSQKII